MSQTHAGKSAGILESLPAGVEATAARRHGSAPACAEECRASRARFDFDGLSTARHAGPRHRQCCLLVVCA